MEIPVIRIGNSKGIILNKTLLKRYGFQERLEMVIKQGHIELHPVTETRKGWDEQFRQMHHRGEDRPLMDELFEEDYLEEWK